jgi:hypothetical protein
MDHGRLHLDGVTPGLKAKPLFLACRDSDPIRAVETARARAGGAEDPRQGFVSGFKQNIADLQR